nr:FtsQ-type POTRA domain-containing protein [uncultured Eubacterium sp.]
MTDSRTGEFNRETLHQEDAYRDGFPDDFPNDRPADLPGDPDLRRTRVMEGLENDVRSDSEGGTFREELSRETRTFGAADPADTFYHSVDYSYAEYPGTMDENGVYRTSCYDDIPGAEWENGDFSGDSNGEESGGRDEYGFNDIPRKRKQHHKKHYMLRFAVVLAVFLGAAGFLMSSVFDVQKYEVTGNHYYSDQEVVNISNAATGVNIFRRDNVKNIRRRLLANPYFTEVKVKRKLPSTMVIQVTERKQTAAFLYGASYIVVDGNGLVLRKTDVKPEITLIQGFHLTRMDVGKKIGVEETSMLDQTLDMLASTRKGNFYFKQIDASSVMVRGHVTDTLLVKGSPRQLKNVIDNGDLQKVVSKLFRGGIRRGTLSVGEENYISFSPKV